jgi:hypothetical protein
MNVINVQKVLAWIILCTIVSELLTQSIGGSTRNCDGGNTILPNVRGVVAAFTAGSSSSLSSSITTMIRTQESHFMTFDVNKFTQPSPSSRKRIAVSASTNDDESASTTTKSTLPFYLDPNTKGGVVVLTFVLFLGTYITDQIFINVFNYDEIDAGITIGMGFTVLSTLAWMSTYLFRVATKDMTYVSLISFTLFHFAFLSVSYNITTFEKKKK